MLLSESNYYQLVKEMMQVLPSMIRKKETPNGNGRKEKVKMFLFVIASLININKFNISNFSLLSCP